jgi:beta-glucuronidase
MNNELIKYLDGVKTDIENCDDLYEYFDDVLSAALSNTRLCGVTLWQFCDARSYHRRGPVRVKPLSTNLAGLFDGYRRPKLAVEVVRRHFKGK